MKKILSVILALALLGALWTPAAAETQTKASLKFGADGKFTILVFCDTHERYPMRPSSIALMRAAIAEAKPDLIVLGGDNMLCKGTKIYKQLTSVFVKAGVPFTLVFGNHDRESSDLTREEQLLEYQRAGGEYCLAYDAVPELHGCGTHNLPILSSDGTRTAFNLWMFDSGDYVPEGGYDCVRRDQLDWYLAQSEALERENGGKVPSIAFQHIIVKEVYDALYKPAGEGDEVAHAFADGTKFTDEYDHNAYEGILAEPPCPSSQNDGEWDAFVQRGDVLGCVTGHDHVNGFVARYKGVDMIQSPSISHHTYGKIWTRGARVITLDENDPWQYETHILYETTLALHAFPLLSFVTLIPHFVYAIYDRRRPALAQQHY